MDDKPELEILVVATVSYLGKKYRYAKKPGSREVWRRIQSDWSPGTDRDAPLAVKNMVRGLPERIVGGDEMDDVKVTDDEDMFLYEPPQLDDVTRKAIVKVVEEYNLATQRDSDPNSLDFLNARLLLQRSVLGTALEDKPFRIGDFKFIIYSKGDGVIRTEYRQGDHVDFDLTPLRDETEEGE
jgi:hypothetical protein